jgi:uncharacterized membrane protein
MFPDPLHPAVVHFPIVLAVLAPFFAAGTLWAIRKGARPRRAWSLTFAALGALVASSWVATETGEQQEERVEEVVSEQPLESHEEAAQLFLLTAAGVLGVAAIGFAGGRVGQIARIAGTAGSLALVGMGWNVGHSGGALVYQHGAASAYTGGAGRTLPGERESEEETGSAQPAPARGDVQVARASATLADAVTADSARARLAEAGTHFERVMPLVRNFHNARAGTEVMLAAEDVEWAARATGTYDEPRTLATLRDARQAGALLMRQSESVPISAGLAVEALGVEIQRRAIAASAGAANATATPARRS